MTAISRRFAYETTVDAFEERLAEFTGAPLVIATDTCTNAIHMCLQWYARNLTRPLVFDLLLPKHNYVGVAQAAFNAGYKVEWTDERWEKAYQLRPLPLFDCAKYFRRDMWHGAYGGHLEGQMMCLSFGTSKLLPIGKGGAILLESQEAYDWIRPRTMDGRTPGEDYQNPSFVTPAWRCNMTPEMAARGLDLLTYIDDPPDDTWESYPDLSKATWT